jgi:hypothetical protein
MGQRIAVYCPIRRRPVRWLQKLAWAADEEASNTFVSLRNTFV